MSERKPTNPLWGLLAAVVTAIAIFGGFSYAIKRAELEAKAKQAQPQPEAAAPAPVPVVPPGGALPLNTETIKLYEPAARGPASIAFALIEPDRDPKLSEACAKAELQALVNFVRNQRPGTDLEALRPGFLKMLEACGAGR